MADYSLNATLTYREDINPELAIFRVKPDSGVPGFMPGQYAELAFPGAVAGDSQRVERRSYSIASSPSGALPQEGGELEFYIVRVEGGYFTTPLWNLAVGGRLWCGPKIKGKFTLEEVPRDTDVVMVATGTGLAPFISMLREHTAHPPWKSVALIHGARLQNDLGYRRELNELAKQASWFHYLPTLTREPADSSWSGHRGRVQHLFQEGHVASALGRPLSRETTHILLCGNPVMITDLEEYFATLGLKQHKKKDPGNIHVERYW